MFEALQLLNSFGSLNLNYAILTFFIVKVLIYVKKVSSKLDDMY
jgi:hypothetical protein